MFSLFQLITITQIPTQEDPDRNSVLKFHIVNNIEIEKSFDNMTQKASITMPKSLKYKDLNIYEGEGALIRRGDKVKIECGYMPNLITEFEGYVSRVSSGVPIEIKCEDDMWLLKQTIVSNKSYADVSLSQLLNDIIPASVNYKAISAIGLGSIRINEATVSVVLDKLRENYGIYSFFEDGILKVGLPYNQEKYKVHTFLFERHIIDNNMEFLRYDDVRVKIKGVLINGNNRQEIEVGAKDGDLRTVFIYGGTIDDLKKLCNSKLKEYNYTGFNGSFTTFLAPSVNHGDHIVLKSYKNKEYEGTYLVKSVGKKCGVNGGRQVIELDRRLL